MGDIAFQCRSYAFTAVFSFVILSGFFLACEIVYWVEIFPMTRGFDAGDITIAYSKKPDTVEGWTYVGICLTVPPILMLAYEFCYWYLVQRKLRRDWRFVAYVVISDVWITFFIGLGATVALTNLLKYVVARPRPYFLEACQPNYTKIECDVSKCIRYPYCPHCGLIDFKKFGNICTGRTSLRDDMWLSFPSLHASHVTFAMLFLIAYIHFRVMKTKIATLYFTAVAAAVEFAAFSFVLYTCATRVADNRHHWEDVIGGILLAVTFVAWATHSLVRSIHTHHRHHFLEKSDVVVVTK